MERGGGSGGVVDKKGPVKTNDLVRDYPTVNFRLGSRFQNERQCVLDKIIKIIILIKPEVTQITSCWRHLPDKGVDLSEAQQRNMVLPPQSS